MAEAKLSVYNLGSLGVNVDKSPIHLEDGELLQAQNAIKDPLGLEGGLRKRPGLIQMNLNTGAGSFLGGIGVPLVLSASSINGVTLGATTRTTYWGRSTSAVGFGTELGWYTSTSGFTTVSGLISTGTPANPRCVQLSTTLQNSLHYGMPNAAVVIKNRMYYPGTYTIGTDNPPINIFDGTTDKEFVRIPPQAGATPANTSTINSMLAVGNIVYLTVADGNSGWHGTGGGRVFALDTSSGVLTPIGAVFGADLLPYSIAFHGGRIWVGVLNRGAGTGGGIYFFRPGLDTAWTLDRTMASGGGTATLISFQGQLFAGSFTGAGASSIIEVRSSLGVWSNSLTIASSGSSGFMAAVVFGANLYTSHWTNSAAASTVRKFDGTTWSTALTITVPTVPLPTMWVDQGVMYAGGGGNALQNRLSSTTDGTTWTDRTANLNSTYNGISTLGVLTS